MSRTFPSSFTAMLCTWLSGARYRRALTGSKSVRASGSLSGPSGQGRRSNAPLGSPHQRSKFSFDRVKAGHARKIRQCEAQQFGRVIRKCEPNEPRRCRRKDRVQFFFFIRAWKD